MNGSQQNPSQDAAAQDTAAEGAAEPTRWSRVAFPADVDAVESFEVYVNGIKQQPDEDFELVGDDIFFLHPVRREGRLSWWRWLWISLGLVGSYGKNDVVDVVCREGGRTTHHAKLPIDVLIEAPVEKKKFVKTGPYSPGG